MCLQEFVMLRVVAAVIHNPQGEILIARRPLHKHQGGLWEFPGGKIEEGESAGHALIRELQEELGITPTEFRPLLTVEHHYPDKSVRLEVWRVTAFDGQAHGAEGQPVAWVQAEQLRDYDFPAANTPILKAAVLPEVYRITPDPADVGDLAAWMTPRLAADEWWLLRARSLSPEAYAALAAEITDLCREKDVRLMLHGFSSLALAAPVHGIHLTASDLRALPDGWCRDEAGLSAQQYLSCSTHGTEELAKAWRLGADMVTLSPVRETRSHPGMPGMGWEVWEKLAKGSGLPVYALGGMQREDLPLARRHGAQGVAGISGLF